VLVEVCALISVLSEHDLSIGRYIRRFIVFLFFFGRKGGVDVKNWCYECII
jgi:hypothetical protein